MSVLCYYFRMFYHHEQKSYLLTAQTTLTSRNHRSDVKLRYDGQEYFANFNSTRRLYMNDVDVASNIIQSPGKYKDQPFNFFSILPPTDFGKRYTWPCAWCTIIRRNQKADQKKRETAVQLLSQNPVPN